MNYDHTISIYAAGFKGQKDSSIALILIADAPDGRQIKHRFTNKVDDLNRNKADLMAVYCGLSMIKSPFKDCKIHLHAPLGYAMAMIEQYDGQWKINPQANKKIIEKIRTLINGHSNITISTTERNDAIAAECYQLARTTALAA